MALFTSLMLGWLLTVPAPQERGADPEALYQAAVLRRESERDPAGALPLFEQVASSPAASEDLRQRALLRVAECLADGGRREEAAVVARGLAGAEGAIADRAAALLADLENGGTDRLQRRAESAVLSLYGEGSWEGSHSDAMIQSPGLRDLEWIGEPSIAVIERHLASERVIGEPVFGRLVRALVRIGGPQAAEALDRLASSPDLMVRRETMSGVAGRGIEVEPVASSLRRFLEDPDPRIRELAVQRLGETLPIEPMISLLEEEPDAGVRAAAVQAAVDEDWLERWLTSDSAAARILPLIERQFGERATGAAERALRVLRWEGLLYRPAGRELFLRALQDASLQDLLPRGGLHRGPLDRLGRLPEEKVRAGVFQPPIPARDLLTAGAEVQRAFQGKERDSRRDLLIELARLSVGNYSRDERGNVMDLCRAGLLMETSLAAWWREHADVGDAPLLAELALDTGDEGVAHLACEWIRQRVEEFALPERAQLAELLGRCVEPLATGERGERGSASRWPDGVPQMFALVLRLDGVQAGALLRGLVEPQPRLAIDLALAHLDEAALQDALREMFVRPFPDESSRAANLRGELARQFAEDSVREGLELLPEAYRLPMSDVRERSAPKGPSLRGMQWLVYAAPGEDSFRFAAGLDDADRSRLIGRCMEGNTEDMWRDLKEILKHRKRQPGETLYWLPPVLLETIAAQLFKAPVEVADRDAMLAHVQSLWPEGRAMLLDLAWQEPVSRIRRDMLKTSVEDAPEDQARVARFLQDPEPEVVVQAIETLASAGWFSQRERLDPLLGSAMAGVRIAALEVLAEADEEAAREVLPAFLEDPHWMVRRAAATISARVFDEHTAERVLRLLRDPDPSVRTAAETAVAKIELYYRSLERWQQWVGGAGLDARSAQVRLLEQAATGNDLEIRVAAIQSLGTIGDPPVLPHLVELLRDADSKVREAARKALDRINARGDSH